MVNDSKGRGNGFIPADTSSEAHQAQIDLWRRMSPVEKAAVIGGVSMEVRQLSLAGIRLRYPDASERECHLRLAILTLGRDLACKVYPGAAGLVASHA